MKRYLDCQRSDGNCSVCSLSSYGKDCRNEPVNRLAYWRSMSNLSQSQLACAVGISVRTLQDYEQNRKPIERAAAITVYHLARAVGKTVEDIIDVT